MFVLVLLNYCDICMHVNQKCYVKLANEFSEPFTVANGVKQSAVISPLLFSIYIDNLFKELKQLGLGCHVGPTFSDAYGYADDVALIAPSLYALYVNLMQHDTTSPSIQQSPN